MPATLRPAAGVDPQQVLASIWQRNLPVIRQRLETLERAAQDAQQDRLSPAARSEASGLAHKLAGSLGMFGYAQGTRIAQQLEALLDTCGAVDGVQFADLTGQLRHTLHL